MCIRDSGDTVSVEGSSMTYGTVTFAEDTSWSYDLDQSDGCLLYTSDAADERSSVDLGGRRIIKKKKIHRYRR